MDFIFMLTRHDRTVEDCAAVLDEALGVGLRHIGVKDIGVPAGTLREVVRRIRDAGATSYLEVVSTTRAAALRSAALAVEIGVDRLLGGTEVDATLRIIAGTPIQYFPFAGFPEGHPTRLGGSPDDIADHCATFVAKGCHGADLLAYRALAAEPLALVRAARAALGAATLIVAGSVNSFERIRELNAAGADAFTIGSAIFDGSLSPASGTVRARLLEVMAACEGRAAA